MGKGEGPTREKKLEQSLAEQLANLISVKKNNWIPTSPWCPSFTQLPPVIGRDEGSFGVGSELRPIGARERDAWEMEIPDLSLLPGGKLEKLDSSRNSLLVERAHACILGNWMSGYSVYSETVIHCVSIAATRYSITRFRL
jgi:hypothetical protein